MIDVIDTQAGLQLFGTLGCHLCEVAEQQLIPLLQAGCRVEAIDIAEDDALLARYQTLIPVLRNARGDELHWPFNSEDAQALWGAAC